MMSEAVYLDYNIISYYIVVLIWYNEFNKFHTSSTHTHTSSTHTPAHTSDT